ncbi:MAG: UDP-4-amino-4-deoxy-L-arabinose--oxoglutarate aminotransferase [Candidatus Hinthialibacteria bacterium OLB16]|nr:MAG: UDP-4-amino-4-deoxy-L-arabinose--oxoglutarate aminotransferase [Candidatus Hinthialibacteria bacterium OLB16]
MTAPKVKFELESKFGSEYGPEEEQAVLEVLRKGAPTSGDACIQFEKEFAAYIGSAHARVVSNGTAALFLSLIALDIRPGDRVLTTPLTWIATAAAACTLGAEVDFVDVDPATYNIDPNEIEKKVTANTRVVIPVHLYGQCCDMDPILDLSRKHGFAVVEDACHAVGGEYRGIRAGHFGATGCFSFHEQKNMSTLGEGGMIVTDDPDLFERIALYRSHCARVYGNSTKYCRIDESQFPMGKRFWWQDFDDAGYNFRMTDIQAAAGLIQLRKLEQLNARRIQIAQILTEGLKDIPGLTLPTVAPGCKHVFHLYPLLIDPQVYGMNKEDFIYTMLHDCGIKVGTHYNPLNWTQAFQKRGFHRGQYPVAESIAEKLVTLPIHPRMTVEGIEYLVGCIRKHAQR